MAVNKEVNINALIKEEFVNYILNKKVPTGLVRIHELENIISDFYLSMSVSYLNASLTPDNTLADLINILPIEVELFDIQSLLSSIHEKTNPNSENDIMFEYINNIKHSISDNGLISKGVPFFANFFNFNIIKVFVSKKDYNYKLRLSLKDDLYKPTDTINKAYNIYLQRDINFKIENNTDIINNMLYKNANKISKVLNYINNQLFLYKNKLKSSTSLENGFLCQISIPINEVPINIQTYINTFLCGNLFNYMNLIETYHGNIEFSLPCQDTIKKIYSEFNRYIKSEYVSNMFDDYTYQLRLEKTYDKSKYEYVILIYDKKVSKNN